VQDHGLEPNSDDELLLMSEVESLQSQLIKNGRPLNEKIENMFMKSIESKVDSKSLVDRIRTMRRDHLRNLAERPHATSESGGPAVSLGVVGTARGLQADKHMAAVKEEEKEKEGGKSHA
jgi:hypothetical protein